ncbi:MAG: 50S ribosomal protein L21 [Candidatus Neomarinimicrobiota bacterium]|nr:MAG: 50S ribosomal protein L21 [Candidatus Neomarinimicrobiota bacterium]
MYAIAVIAGKQFKLSEKATLKVPRLESQPGDKVKVDQVLLAHDGKKIHIGSPLVPSASVSLQVLQHGRDRKVFVYKKKRRKGYQRKNGHRQGYTLVQVEKISLSKPRKTAPKAATPKAKTQEEA